MTLINLLKKKGKKLIKIYGDYIEDMVLFGSFMKGKEAPNDIDLLIVFRKKINKEIEYEIKKELENISNIISIISKTKDNLYDENFTAREGVIFEGKSISTNKYINEKWGFESFGIFKYKTKGMKNTKKTQFYYALNGRCGEGMVNNLDMVKLSDNIVIVPLKKIEPAKEFFNFWKIEYKFIPVMFPKRLAKTKILKKISLL